MNFLFSILSIAYIAGIFLLADSPVVSDIAPFNPYSLLHIPLYGILTLLLILSFPPQRKRSIDATNSIDPINSRNSRNPINPMNYWIAGTIALVVSIADEIHQAYIPNRNASVIDALLDLVGIICCILLVRCFQSQSGFSKVKDFLRRGYI